MRSRFAVAILAALAAVLLPVAARAQAPEIKWGPAPAVFPAGTRMAVLQGDPSQSAMFTVRLELPAGTRLAPHFHPTDEQVTVITGTFLVGMGDSIDVAKALVLPAGSFITAPANAHHYGIARGRTVVQVSAIGPFALTYVNPKDAPQPAASK
ncbi:MAG TPA: cupin domain-containing protein [Gemmatimonadales bacterium]|nr:cupin domain-containing protein [Gemmatimonadales bacterium]